MNKLPWFKFFPDDWITGTREMNAEEKSAWIDLLAFMWKSDNRGSVSGTWEGIARMLGLPWLNCEDIITRMRDKKYLNLTEANGIITVTSRRMKREENSRESNRFRQRRHYTNAKPNANLTDKKSEDRSQKTEKDNIFVDPTPQNGDGPTAQDLIELWNNTAHPTLPRVQLLTEPRKRKAMARLADNPNKQFWDELMKKINRSPLLTGQNGSWRCTFDWILEPRNLAKVVEGNYEPGVRR